MEQASHCWVILFILKLFVYPMKIKTRRVVTTLKEEGAEPFTSQMTQYDNEGREISNTVYEGPDLFESKTEIKYDEKGLVAEELTFEDESTMTERKCFTRRDDGEIERIVVFFADGTQSIKTVERDHEALTESWVEKDEDDELESRELLHYNNDKLLQKRELFDHRDKLTEAYEYEYNEAGEVSKRRQLDNRRKLVVETEITYTDSGLLELRANRNRKGQLSDFIKMEYDEKGQVTRQNISNKYFFEFEYDDHGNVLVEERYVGDELENRTTFKYNDNNLPVLEEHPDFIKEYQYEYYE